MTNDNSTVRPSVTRPTTRKPKPKAPQPDVIDGQLSPQRRKVLKAQAHGLDPSVMIGNAGLTDGVLAELERSLLAHELVKLRVNAEREQREQILTELCARTGAMAVQHIGKMLVVFRSSPVLRAKEARAAKALQIAARNARAGTGRKPGGRSPDARQRGEDKPRRRDSAKSTASGSIWAKPEKRSVRKTARPSAARTGAARSGGSRAKKFSRD
jgi:RNA-binding protein